MPTGLGGGGGRGRGGDGADGTARGLQSATPTGTMRRLNRQVRWGHWQSEGGRCSRALRGQSLQWYFQGQFTEWQSRRHSNNGSSKDGSPRRGNSTCASSHGASE